MWTYNQNPVELYHHGIKGMRWGVRRYQNEDGSLTPAGKRRAARADKRIERYETLRSINAKRYEDSTTKLKSRYSNPKKEKKLEKRLARNKAQYDATEVNNKYSIARQKAKKDSSYKETAEYKDAVSAYKKQSRDAALYGRTGQMRVSQLKNLGYSEKQAKGRVLTETLLKEPAFWAVGITAMRSKQSS